MAQVIQAGPTYMVESTSKPGMFYAVRLAGDILTCTCQAYRYSKTGVCKHMTAAARHANETRASRGEAVRS